MIGKLNTQTKKNEIWRPPVKLEKTFEDCVKCTRPYKKTEKYPNEVCPACEMMEKL